MKISIVIPSNNEAQYVENLINYIKIYSDEGNIEEIIIVESFNTKNIIKIAEKNHAKLYYNLIHDKLIQMEMGAFQSKGDIIYFIKPNCTPPKHFDKKIISFVKRKYSMGCLDFESNNTECFYKKIKTFFNKLFLKDIFHGNSFFVMNKYFHQIGGFKQYQKYSRLEKQVLFDSTKFYL